jgi:hypothetical protein
MAGLGGKDNQNILMSSYVNKNDSGKLFKQASVRGELPGKNSLMTKSVIGDDSYNRRGTIDSNMERRATQMINAKNS